jgi:dipeptidyl aminopeptidase/acylaminoacyl peptidase
MTSKTSRRAFMAASAAALAAGGTGYARAEKTSDAEAEANPAPSEPPPIEAFASLPSIEQITISPSGTRIAFITSRNDQKLLVYFDVASEKLQSVSVGPAKIRGLFFGDDSHVILINSQTNALEGFVGNKHEFMLASSINIETGHISNFFNHENGYYNIVCGNLQRIKMNGVYQVTASNYEINSPYSLNLFSFDLEHDRGLEICEGTPNVEEFIVAPDGWIVAYSEFDEDSKEWRLNYNQAGPGEPKRFRPIYKMKDALETPSLEGIGRNGDAVVILMAKGDAKGEYREISADGALSAPLDTGTSVSSSPLFHPTTGRLAGFAHHDDWFSYDYSDPMMRKLAEAVPQVVEGRLTSMIDFAEDSRKMIIYAEGKGNAGQYYFADFSTGAVRTIASNYANLPTEWISQKQAIDYKAADGLNIHAYLTLPPNLMDAKNLPVIVLPHGGPQARDYIDFDWQTQCLASRGYAVLQPNFRGSTGYGQEFIDAAHGEFGRKMQTDLSDGVRYLAGQGIIDPKRVAIMGASYGGYAALAGATLDPGVYNCAVSIAGVADPKSFIDFVAVNRSGSAYSSAVLYWKQMMGAPKTYDDISPVHQAAKASCPILLIHGTDDTVVPIEQSQRMESALKAANKPVEFVTYKGQDHWETIGSARIDMMKAALAFLEKYNPA